MNMFFILISCFMLALVQSSKICTLKDDMKYQFTDCDNEAYTTNLFFYYPNSLHCDVTPGKSEELPPFMSNIKCDQLCQNHGEYLKVKFDSNKKTYLECDKCPANSISIRGGFLYDAQMETKKYFPDKSNAMLKGFKTSCLMVDFSPEA